MEAGAIEQSNLVLLTRAGSGGKVYWDAQWRFRAQPNAPWRLKKQRIGLAWLEPDGAGGWRKRRGRRAKGWLDERTASIAANEAMQVHGATLAADAEHDRRERERPATFREVAAEWMIWLRDVRGAKPSTLYGYDTLLREPGSPHRRGPGTNPGRILGAFGDMPAADITTRDITTFLRGLDAEGFTPRNVNRYRQVLHAVFNYGRRIDSFELPGNPVDAADKRREPLPAALDYYEVEEVEALARACEAGHQRRGNVASVDPAELAARRHEDRQDADAFRVLFYTGLRLGELLALRWSDVDLAACLLLVRRSVSEGVETEPKGRRHRFVPLADGALAALARLGDREEFVGAEDYVVCNRWGRRLDGSALRRRYRVGCEAAGLRPVKLHGLRHAAGSIIARTTDAVYVRDFLGHAKLATTDRYVSAKHRPEDLERLNRAFAGTPARDVARRSA